MTTSVLLVDDHAVVRQGLQHLIEVIDGFRVVADASNADDAVALARQHRPGIIILDLLMPDKSGIDAIPCLQAASPGSHIAVLSSTEDARLTLGAIKAGAQSFLLKTMSGRALVEALTSMASGHAFFHPDVTHRVVSQTSQPQSAEKTRFDALSPGERRVMLKMAEGNGNAAIAASLFISEKTVKSHLSSIFAKIDANDRTEAVAMAWRSGFMSSTPTQG